MIYGDDLKKHPKSAYTKHPKSAYTKHPKSAYTKHPKSAYTKDNEALHFYVKDVRILTPKE